MKHFFKLMLFASLLFSGAGALTARDCNDRCNDSCNTSCNTNCNTGCNFNSCGTDRRDACATLRNCQSCCNQNVRTYLQFRSQGANTARELVGWQWLINLPEMCENYGAFYAAYEFQRTFRPERIACSLFGSPTLRFAGSLVADRAGDELLADNFGLSRHFKGQVSFCPRITNHILDLGWYQGLDCWATGTYLRIHAPIVNSRWQLCECVQTTSVGDGFTPCYIGEGSVTGLTPAASSLEQALSGTFTTGDLRTPWCAGRFNFCRRSKTRLADIDVILGWNWHNNDCSHLGAYLQAVIPTGGKPNNLYVFDPVVGNGGHFELGFGLSAHHVFWSCGDANLALFVEGNVTHMFRNRQCRLFDFCANGAYSRYALLKEYDYDPSNSNFPLTYNGNLVSATCFANREVNVRIDVKGDASVKLAYRWCGWGIDIGYNLYGHSREKVKLVCNECDPGCHKYQFKGTEPVCCFSYPIVNVGIPGGPVTPTIFPDGTILPAGSSAPAGCTPLAAGDVYTVRTLPSNANQPCATAYAPVENSASFTACSNDCAVFLAAPPAQQVTDPAGFTNLTSAGLEAAGFTCCSITSTFKPLDLNDLNLESGSSPCAFTQKVFGHINYIWADECGWNPHIGIGGEGEFDFNRRRNCGNDRRDSVARNCCKASLNQWGVWIKGGFSY